MKELKCCPQAPGRISNSECRNVCFIDGNNKCFHHVCAHIKFFLFLYIFLNPAEYTRPDSKRCKEEKEFYMGANVVKTFVISINKTFVATFGITYPARSLESNILILSKSLLVFSAAGFFSHYGPDYFQAFFQSGAF